MAKTRKKRDKSALSQPVSFVDEDRKLVRKARAKPLPSPSVDFSAIVLS